MSLKITVGKNAAGEQYYSGSVIARETFSLTVSGSSSTSAIIYANSPTDDLAFKLGTVSLRNGSGTATGLKITSVYGTDSGRKITVKDSAGNVASISVGVWFKGDATVFNIGGSAGSGACGGTVPTYCVALPAKLCSEDVVVYNPTNGKIKAAKVQDIGPLIDSKCCGYDPYWNTGTVPFTIQHKGEIRTEVCNCPSDYGKYKFQGAIIDLNKNLLSALGATGTITNALWRFN